MQQWCRQGPVCEVRGDRIVGQLRLADNNRFHSKWLVQRRRSLWRWHHSASFWISVWLTFDDQVPAVARSCSCQACSSSPAGVRGSNIRVIRSPLDCDALLYKIERQAPTSYAKSTEQRSWCGTGNKANLMPNHSFASSTGCQCVNAYPIQDDGDDAKCWRWPDVRPVAMSTLFTVSPSSIWSSSSSGKFIIRPYSCSAAP